MFSRFVHITLFAALLGLAGSVSARASDDYSRQKMGEIEHFLRGLERYGNERRKMQVGEARNYFAFVRANAAARFRLVPWFTPEYTPSIDPEAVRATEAAFALRLRHIADLMRELHAAGDSFLVETVEMDAADAQIELLAEEIERLRALRIEARALARGLADRLNQRRTVRLGLRKPFAATDFPDLMEYGSERLRVIELEAAEMRRRYAEAEIRRRDLTGSACHDALLPASLET